MEKKSPSGLNSHNFDKHFECQNVKKNKKKLELVHLYRCISSSFPVKYICCICLIILYEKHII